MSGEFVVATRSAHKLREIREIVGDGGLRLLSLDDAGVEPRPEEEDAIEAFDTFEENALAKARYFAERTGRTVLADDSGICVDALGGAPGVRSKRFSGRDDLTGQALDDANLDLLLERLRGLPTERRGAHYACAVAIATAAGHEHVVTGRCDGHILRTRAGSGGFGYDPVFQPLGYDRSFGELPAATKHQISHRARALRAAIPALRRALDDPGNG